MKFLELVWKSLYWSCLSYIVLCFVVLFTIPDHITGFVLAVFVAPFFGIPIAIIKFIKPRKPKLS
jgi:Sec-independent protein secretion pathway component TatC